MLGAMNYTNNIKQDTRHYGVELLRIVLMIFIVIQHYFSHAGVLELVDNNPFSFSWGLSYFLRIICYTAVTCFFLISGFFLCEKHFSIKRIIHFWLELFFYSVISYIVFAIYSKNFNAVDLLKSLFPISSRQYGFANNYFFLLLSFPLLNIIVNKLDKKTHFIFIIIFTILLSIVPYIFFVDSFNTRYGDGIIWVYLLFLISSFYKKYLFGKNYKKSILFILFVSLILIQLVLKIAISFITYHVFGEIRYSNAFIGETPILSLFTSILLFVLFTKIGNDLYFSARIKKIILFFSSSVFSVYLISTNPYTYSLIWTNIIKLWSLLKVSPFESFKIGTLFLSLSLSVLIIFTACIIIDKLRLLLFRVTKIESGVHFLLGRNSLEASINNINNEREN